MQESSQSPELDLQVESPVWVAKVDVASVSVTHARSEDVGSGPATNVSPYSNRYDDRTLRSLLHEHLGSGRVRQHLPGDLPDSSFTALQSAELDFGGYALSVTSGNVGFGNSNVLLFRLGVRVSAFRMSEDAVGSACRPRRTYIGVGGIDHDTVKLDAILLRTADGQLERLV